jgi:predicted ATPase
VRIVVSGTHASGKSTLIADVALRHPGWDVLPDPFELLDDASDGPSAAMFAAQLRLSADRLIDETSTDVIAERGPLDFLAYLVAWAELSGSALDQQVRQQATALVVAAMRTVDVLVVLPLAARDAIHVSADEHLELREAMNDVLLEMVDDPELIGDHLLVREITGTPAERVAAVEALLR